MPRMLESIRGAQKSISLASYIFEATGIGADFGTELSLAAKRGVQVRVMVDDAGTRYSWPPVVEALTKAGVTARRFMPNHLILRPVSYTHLDVYKRQVKLLMELEGEADEARMTAPESEPETSAPWEQPSDWWKKEDS